MELSVSPRTLTVTDPAQARVLLDPDQRRYLEPFIGRAKTVKEAAEETGARLNTLLYAVQRLVRLGLLEVAETRPRKGRAVVVYRSSAEAYFVPHTAIQHAGLEEAIAQVNDQAEGLLRRNIIRARNDAYITWGIRVFRDPWGEININAALDAEHDLELLAPDSPAAFSAWFDELHLDFADAKALQRELLELARRYRNKSGSQRYVMRLGLAPVLR